MSAVELGAAAFWWVLAIGFCSGALSVFAFQRWSPAGQLRAAVNPLLAHLMEFRLFADEPRLILRAQRDLLLANARLLRVILGPFLLLAVPYAVVLAIAGAFFGRAPLRSGEAAVVTAHYKNEPTGVQLILPAGFELETPPVRVQSESQLSWRIRASREAWGNLQLRSRSQVIEKTVSAQSGLQWISDRRSTSVLGSLAHPGELPFTAGAIDWVAVQYPAAMIFGSSWLVWFSLAASAGALFSTIGGFRR